MNMLMTKWRISLYGTPVALELYENI